MQVPYQPYPTVGPEQTPTQKINIPTPPDAFGASIGQAVEGLGRTLEHSGDELFQRALAIQQLRNETEAKEADAQYMIKAGDLHAKFNALEGKNRVDAYPQYSKDLQDLRVQMRQGLSTDQARKMFDGPSLQTMGRSIFNGAGAAAAADKQYADGASDARVHAAITSLWTSPDEGTLKQALSTVQAEAASKAANKGWSPEQKEEYVKTATSSAYATRLMSLAKTEPIKAQELADKHRSFLLPQDAEKVDDRISSQLRQGESYRQERDINKDLKEGVKDERPLSDRLVEADERARKIAPNDAVFAETLRRRVEAGYEGFKKGQRDENEKNRFTVTNGILGFNNPQGKLPTTIEELTSDPATEAAYNKLTPPQKMAVRNQLTKNAKDDVIETPERMARYHTLLGQRLSEPAAFLDVDLMKESLPRNRINELYKLQLQVQKGVEGDPRTGLAMSNLEPTLRAAGITRQINKDQYDQFKGALGIALESWRTENKKPPTPEQIRTEIAPTLLRDMHDPNAFQFFGLRHPTAKVFELTTPTEVEEEMKKQLRARGVSEDEVNSDTTKDLIRQQWVKENYDKLLESARGRAPK